MASPSIVEHLDIHEQIGSGFFTISIANPNDPFWLEDTKEAFDGGVVIAVADIAHAAVDAVLGQFVAEVVTCIPPPTIGTMYQRACRPTVLDRHPQRIDDQTPTRPPTRPTAH